MTDYMKIDENAAKEWEKRMEEARKKKAKFKEKDMIVATEDDESWVDLNRNTGHPKPKK